MVLHRILRTHGDEEEKRRKIEKSSCIPSAFLVYYLSRLAWAPETVRVPGPASTASEYKEKDETYVRNHRYRR